MIPELLCRFDGELAAGVLDTPRGCIAFPEDRQQILCAQHLLSAPDGALGDWRVLWICPTMREVFR